MDDVLEFVQKSSKDDLENLDRDKLLEILQGLGIAATDCLWLEYDSGFSWWVPLSVGRQIVIAVSGVQVSPKYLHAPASTGDVRTISIGPRSTLYSVVDILKLRVRGSASGTGNTRRQDPAERKPRIFHEETREIMKKSQRTRRERERNS